MNNSPDPAAFAPTRQAFVGAGAPFPAPERPSFADALRQRGLLAKATLSAGIASGWTSASDTWLALDSIYESHLRRALMEQAQALLRGDTVAEEPAI